MANFKLYNQSAQEVGEIELADAVFGAEVKPHLHWELVKMQRANRRAGTHSTKTRAEVKGSTKKIYRQKGTGNARHGARKAPIFVGGGRAHGPKPRDYSYTVPKKVKAAALRSALSARPESGDLIVLDGLSFDTPKTKQGAATLAKLGASNALVVVPAEDNNVHMSIRNLHKVKYIRAEGVNVYDVLKYEKLVLTADAARALELRLG